MSDAEVDEEVAGSEAEEDEVFFGPLTVTELQGMKRNVVSSIHTPTPNPAAVHVVGVQALCRGYLARQEYRKRRDDMRFLAVKGEFSVERRRRWVAVSRPSPPLPPVPPADDQPPPTPPTVAQSRRGFRSWFQRSSSSHLSTDMQQQKVTIIGKQRGEEGETRVLDFSTSTSTSTPSSGRARRYL
ncbi:hypothetical protein IWW38_002211, partial [Coemansia aciculifera]